MLGQQFLIMEKQWLLLQLLFSVHSPQVLCWFSHILCILISQNLSQSHFSLTLELVTQPNLSDHQGIYKLQYKLINKKGLLPKPYIGATCSTNTSAHPKWLKFSEYIIILCHCNLCPGQNTSPWYCRLMHQAAPNTMMAGEGYRRHSRNQCDDLNRMSPAILLLWCYNESLWCKPGL